ncbi:hypothetical protein BU26DRAFT_508504 [Trematosphaeria pertusa]|uniref:Uncharacterized protein n=1 Tax=Trematosphaeria pertusa TaxID=390896 RepID=A0A6A6I5F9_9PLEO|nr:uncharacterized protein BU26DRAFT_508504 [Trematosphaeria pertusa]KAF2245192.1 hypothetical protein BU26DRAFT_508504 [Trematosphaeria pertusa]
MSLVLCDSASHVPDVFVSHGRHPHSEGQAYDPDGEERKLEWMNSMVSTGVTEKSHERDGTDSVPYRHTSRLQKKLDEVPVQPGMTGRPHSQHAKSCTWPFNICGPQAVGEAHHDSTLFGKQEAMLTEPPAREEKERGEAPGLGRLRQVDRFKT